MNTLYKYLLIDYVNLYEDFCINKSIDSIKKETTLLKILNNIEDNYLYEGYFKEYFFTKEGKSYKEIYHYFKYLLRKEKFKIIWELGR